MHYLVTATIQYKFVVEADNEQEAINFAESINFEGEDNTYCGTDFEIEKSKELIENYPLLKGE